MSKLRDTLEVDPPVTLNANYRFDNIEISKIDDKIRACEEHLVSSLLRGCIKTNFKINPNTANADLLKPGACVCLLGTSDVYVDAATTALLSQNSQKIVGVLAAQGVPGAFASVIVSGVVPAGLSGIASGSASAVYVNGTTAMLTTIVADCQVGVCDAAGNVIICQGNDARLSDSRRWRQTGPLQIDDSFSGTLPLACMSAPYPIPKVGLPVRICDMQPICYGDTNGNYGGDAVNGALFVGLTGPIYDYADEAGLIYPSMIADGGGSFHVNFYSDVARTKLFGHTASFSAVGSVNFTADNSAALSGTVVIAGTLAASTSASLQLYRYGILDNVNATTGAIDWTGVGIIGCLGIWIGNPEMVVPLDVSIKGSYAEATSSQALFAHNARKVYWDRPTAHLVFLKAEHGVPAEASQPKIAMVHNGVLVHSDANAMTVDTTRGQSNDFLSVDSARRIACSQPVEMRVQAGTGDAQNLSATAVYILE